MTTHHVRWTFFLAFLITSSAVAQVDLERSESVVGFLNHTMAKGYISGIAAADYDDDGDIDVFVPNAKGVADQLYRNRGDGIFDEIATTAGVASTTNNRAGLFFDHDGDGDLDLLVGGDDYYYWDNLIDSTLRLYRQDSPTQFTDITASVGLYGPVYTPEFSRKHHMAGLAATDINNDGFLDVVVTFWKGKVFLYINDGLGVYTEQALAAGIGIDYELENFWQPAFFDFNRDGWQDLFQAVDFQANRFFINDGDGTFTNIADSLFGTSKFLSNDMGVTFGDPDSDGDIDIYVTNTYYTVLPDDQRHSKLFRNDSVGSALAFTPIQHAAGVENAGWGWGTSFADLNNDSWQDLVATNGSLLSTPDVNRIFMNNGVSPLHFTNAAAACGITTTEHGACMIAFDYDRDGDLDLLETVWRGSGFFRYDIPTIPGPLHFYKNNPPVGNPHGNYLVIKPRMIGHNTHAIGALVKVTANGRTTARVITAGISMLGQEPAEAHFGLAGANTADVCIEWPNGAVTVVEDVTANQVLTIDDAPPVCVADITGNGSVDVFDLFVLLSAWGPNPGHIADFDNNNVVNVFDLFVLLGAWGSC